MLSDMTFCSPSFNLMALKSPNFGGSAVTSLRDHSVSSLRMLFRSLFWRPAGVGFRTNVILSKACHTSTVSLYADDTEMHSSSKDIDLAENNVNKDLKSVRNWFRRNGLICNPKKLKLWLLRPRMHLKPPGTLTYSMEIQ